MEKEDLKAIFLSDFQTEFNEFIEDIERQAKQEVYLTIIKDKFNGNGKGGYIAEALITKELIDELRIFCRKYEIKENDLLFDFKFKINNEHKMYKDFINKFGEVLGKKLYIDLKTLKKAEYMIYKVGKIVTHSKNITPHQLRHSLAMLLKKNDVALDKIQQILRHSSITTTQIYAKTTIEDAKDDYSSIMKNK